MVSVDVREVIVAGWWRGWELCSELGSFGSTGFIDNFKRILEEYREEFVAVWNQRVIDADTDLKRLSKSVKEKTRSAKGVYIGYVSDKPVEMIL